MEKSHEVAQGAQAGEFQREDRYLVIKRKDLDLLSPTDRDLALTLMGELSAIMVTWNAPERQYLVVEGDWPEFEPTWAAIQARVTGQGAQAGDERAAFRKEYDAFRQWAGSRLTARQLDLDEVGLFYDEVAGFAHDAWQARATLATQPADGEPKPIGYIHDRWKDNLEGVYHFTTLVRDKHKGWETPVFLDPPAAAHGDEAVRKDAERYRWLRSNCEDGDLCIARSDGFSLRSVSGDDPDRYIDAMRAQGDGEVQ